MRLNHKILSNAFVCSYKRKFEKKVQNILHVQYHLNSALLRCEILKFLKIHLSAHYQILIPI